MAEQCYLGVDLGAESGRVMAGLWDGRHMRLEELHRFPNGPVHVAGTMRWDVLRLWSDIEEGLARAAIRFGKSIVSVGVDTWGVDFVLLSKSGELLGQPYHYRDSRTRGMLEHAFSRVPRAEIFAATGLQFMEISSLYQLLVLNREHPEVLATADRFLMMPDFLHWCLCGSHAVEFTNATTTQCFHPTARDWSRDLLQRLGLPTHMLGEVVPPGTKLGQLRESVAERTGLGRIDVIAPATHDTGSAVAGVPTQHTGKTNWTYISSGTWSLMGVEVPDALLSQRVLELNLTNEGGVNFTYRLLKNIMGLWLVQQCKRAIDARGKQYDYDALVRLATEAAPLRSLVDPDDARFLNPPDMPASIQTFCRETGQPVPETEGSLVRCAIESLALKYQTVLGWLEEVTGNRIETIHVVGGGSRNDLLNKFTANACDRPVVAGPVEATVMGNLLVQARATGETVSLNDIRTIVRESTEVREFEPEVAAQPVWLETQARFTQLRELRTVARRASEGIYRTRSRF
jgi:rhamnulokinase